MAEEPRRGNWEDAANVAMPPCPRCQEANRPGVKPAIEPTGRTGRVFFCTLCAWEWMPTEPPR